MPSFQDSRKRRNQRELGQLTPSELREEGISRRDRSSESRITERSPEVFIECDRRMPSGGDLHRAYLRNTEVWARILSTVGVKDNSQTKDTMLCLRFRKKNISEMTL